MIGPTLNFGTVSVSGHVPGTSYSARLRVTSRPKLMSLVQPLARLLASNCCRTGRLAHSHRHASTLARRSTRTWNPMIWGSVLAIATTLGFSQSTVFADASVKPTPKTEESEEKVVDPATSIAFPKSIRVPAKVPIPPLTLVGLGVRTVSFINIKVYSVGLYADLENPNLHVPSDLSPEQKIEHIVKNTACVVRIIPTRSTGLTHLRDAFTRALNTRLVKAKQSGELTEEQVIQEGSPIRKLAGLFPNSPLTKNTPFDIFLTAPQEGKPRALIFRDLGSVESDWVATNLVLNYVGPECPSPPLKEHGQTIRIPFPCAVIWFLDLNVQKLKEIIAEQVDHFLEHGYIIVKNAFTREQAAEFTSEMWVRLGLDPNDKSTWTKDRIHMPWLKRVKVSEFAPKAWSAIKDLLGGEDRIDEKGATWGDSFIINLGTDELEKQSESLPPKQLDNWHVDGDFFIHYLDSPEQALLVIPLYSDIKPRGGATFIAPDGIDLVAKYLASHPEGVRPSGAFVPSNSTYENPKDDPGYWSHAEAVQRCSKFVELTGEVGDVVLMHPLMLHSASKNHLRIPRVITNPPVALKQPFVFSRENEDDYSLVERKTLKALGKTRFDFKNTTERRNVVPARVALMKQMEEEQRKRLAQVKA
ncbi:hypothetical protein NP233_g628 [Leucocoprinus birnbaumii]|uniref:Chalcone isomerase domain-containing protein n=1 Tax=Leucocoprinus birnbaumii TaxID=56174 RepID=A0AAD5Z066_9AGAR|nr:hypothetical protein NP233_g628 [Leucocoprinus birnbaumii]